MTTIIAAVTAGPDDIKQLSQEIQKQLRRADEFIQLAVAAADLLFSSAGKVLIDPADTALFVGSCFGPMQCNFEVIDDLTEGEFISPSLFSHSVFNAAAGYISRTYRIERGGWTITSFGSPFFSCLENACVCLKAGLCRRALVMQVESYSKLLFDVKRRLIESSVNPWKAGAVAFLLTRNQSDSGLKIEKICCNSKPTLFLNYLTRKEVVSINGKEKKLKDPLAAARELCNMVPQASHCRQELKFTAPWGTTVINMNPMEKIL